MIQEEIEGNKLIAEFMDYTNNYWYQNNELHYHEMWDYLMPVVEKIESTHDDFHGYFGVHISSNGCTIAGTRLNTSIENPHYAYFNDITHETKLSSTWYAVIEFIKWYNQQSKVK
jgi:hypothetical protein